MAHPFISRLRFRVKGISAIGAKAGVFVAKEKLFAFQTRADVFAFAPQAKGGSFILYRPPNNGAGFRRGLMWGVHFGSSGFKTDVR